MKKYWLLLASLAVVLTLSLSGCGGGGGGGGPDPGPGGTNTDLDGDGIPNTEDAYPEDATRFAVFTQVALPGLQGTTFSNAVAINDSNLIVGAANNVQGDTRPVIWQVNATTPSAASVLEISSTFGAAFGVNNGGDTVGEAANATAGRDAIFWLGTAGTPAAAPPVILPAVDAAQVNAAAYDINNARRVVGESNSATGTKAVTWTVTVAGTTVTPSQPLLLGEPVGATASSAYFVGEDNRIVGEHTMNGAARGILWTLSANGATVESMLPLPPLTGDTESVAYGFNAAGRIVGESTSAAGVVRGVIWTIVGAVATAEDLGTPAEGNVLAINDSGRLAGWIAPTVGGAAMASVWDVRNLGLFDSVVAATAGSSQGFGINDAGSIVGMAGNTAFVGVTQ